MLIIIDSFTRKYFSTHRIHCSITCSIIATRGETHLNAQRLPTKQVVRRCPFCGARLNQQDSACPVCGEHLISTPTFQPAALNNPAVHPTNARSNLQQSVTAGRSRALSRAPSVTLAQSNPPTDDSIVRGRPREIVYVRCPACSAQNGLTDLQCGVCGQAFGSVMPVSQGPQAPPRRMARPPRQLAHAPHPQLQAAQAAESILQTSLQSQIQSQTQSQSLDQATSPIEPNESRLIDIDFDANAAVNTQHQTMQAVRARTNRFGSIIAVLMAAVIFGIGIFLFQLGNGTPQTANALPQSPASTQIKLSPQTPKIGLRGNSRGSMATPTVITTQAGPSSEKSPSLIIERAAPNAPQDNGPMPEPTPVILEFYTSPALVSPQDGALISSTLRTLDLRWSSIKALAAEEFYVVYIQPVGANNTFSFKTQKREIAIDSTLLGTIEAQQFTWWVVIQRRMGIDPKTRAPIYQDLSPLSEVRRLQWLTN